MQILSPDSFKLSRWSGGSTTELFILPLDASYDKRDFDLRISSAVIETDHSVFTALPNYERLIMPLSGELKMQHDTGNEKLYQTLEKFEVAHFLGKWNTESFGQLRDFNVIYKPQMKASLKVLSFSGVQAITFDECKLLFLAEGELNVNGEDIKLNSVVVLAKDETIEIHSENAVILSVNWSISGR